MTEALMVPETVESGAIAVRRDPREILAEAHRAAAALKEALDSKKDPVMMNGERYLENEDWQTLGRFYGITAKIESVEFRSYEVPGRDPIYGFEAVAIAVGPDDRVISRAEASCLTDEEKWGARPKYAQVYAKRVQMDDQGRKVAGADGNPIVLEWHPAGYEPDSKEIVWVPNPNKPGKSLPLKSRQLVGSESVPLFQMKSMAQTRASSKVYRQVLAFVPVMAGYKPTPAEELEGFGAERVTVTDERPAAKPAASSSPRRSDRPVAAPHPKDPDDPLPGTETVNHQTGEIIEGEPLITAEQITQLWTVARRAGWKTEEVHHYLMETYQIDSTKKIPASKFAGILHVIESSRQQ